MTQDDLELLFQQARNTPPRADDAALARVLAQAHAEQATKHAVGIARRKNTRAGLFSQALHLIGGWPALAGLSAAAVTGLWIGINPPDMLLTPLSGRHASDLTYLDEMLGTGDGFDFSSFEG